MYDMFAVTFAGNDLSSLAGVELFNHNFHNLPSRDIKINKIARQDLSVITSSEYVSKDISVQVKVSGTSRFATENIITKLKASVQAQNAPLTAWQGDFRVEYTATMNEFQINWVTGMIALVTIGFIASDPIGRAIAPLPLASQNGNTLGLKTYTLAVDGSSVARPTITIVIKAMTGGTNTFVAITNGATDQGIRITRTWAVNDILIIDCLAMTATVNGTVTDFTGRFPEFAPGAQQMRYSDGFTTRTVDLTATYKPRVA